MLQNIVRYINGDIFSDFWNVIKTVFWIIIIIIAIIGVIFVIAIINDSKDSEAAAKLKRENARKAQELENKRKNYHLKYLPNIYDRENSATLLKARALLNIIHVNNPLHHEIGDPNYSVEMESAWADATHKLERLLQNPHWRELATNLNEYVTSSPNYPELDIKYIDHLLAKRKHNQ